MTRKGNSARLEDALPSWDRREHHCLPCDASPAAVMHAAEEVTWREVPIFRGLMTIMSLGRPRFSADEPVLAMLTGAGFEVLARAEDELLVGGIERFSRSRPVVRLPRPDRESFRDFDEPGCVKIAVNFRYTGGTLTTETRVKATDPRSRRLFGLYWLVIRGGSGLIRHVGLRAIRRRANASARHRQPVSQQPDSARREPLREEETLCPPTTCTRAG